MSKNREKFYIFVLGELMDSVVLILKLVRERKERFRRWYKSEIK